MRTVLRTVSVAGLAFAGLVGGHAIGYGLAVPDIHHRSTLIAETGHGYLPSVSWAAAVLGLAALLAGIASGYARRTPNRGHRLARAAVAMAGIQAFAFVLVEFFERVAAGASLETFSPTLLIVGIAVQVVVGLVAVFVLAGLRKLGAALRGDGPALVVVPTLSPRLIEVARAQSAPALTANKVRGPPAATAA